LRKDIWQVQQAQKGSTSNSLQKHIRRIKKYMYTPNTIQTTPTSCKYLTPSSKSYMQDHNGLGGTKKHMKESHKTGF
jgi:hypothetical protein